VAYHEGVGIGEKFSLARLRQAISMRWRSEREKNLEKALEERQKNLEEALEDSCTCILELNMRRNNAERKMGALWPVSRGPEEANAALASYDDWVKKHVSNELADKSDEAMKALSAALTNSANVDLVLGLPHIEEEILLGLPPKKSRDSSDDFDDSYDALETESKSADFAAGGGEGMASGLALRALFIFQARSCSLVNSLVKLLSQMAFKRGRTTDNNLKQAFMSAVEALDAKYKQLESDALGEFPCAALVCAGRHLLETWQAESAAINGLLQAYRMLEEDIRVNAECLDSPGKRSGYPRATFPRAFPRAIKTRLVVQKDEAVRELCQAREEHKKALKTLNKLKPLLEGDEKQTLSFHLEFSFLCILQNMSVNIKLVDLQRNVQVSLRRITDATFKVSGEIQAHFPEVVLFIGKGLPPDLAALWRPPQSLDDGFDNKELVPTESRHDVWRVKQGGAEFAIKEYRVAQASDLRTCLKEAAIIYQQRHLAIVEIKALFQGSGENNHKFYVQMPWYQHGSLDKWVDSNQRPKWRKVRSVLLDALARAGALARQWSYPQ
jgi:hypothetical protein